MQPNYDDILGLNSNFNVEGDIPNQQMLRDQTPELLKGLIDNSEFDKELKLKFDFIFNKDVTLSFQDEESKKSKMIDFDIIKIDTLFSMSYHEYDFPMECKFNKLKFILDTKLDRAKGFKDTKRVNERIAQQSQFSENKSVRSAEGAQEGNFLTRLLGRRR
jgi:hypothetical protein